MRLFIALDIDEAIRERIHLFIQGVAGFAPEVRWVKPESLHVTLKFIGEQPAEAVDPIKQALAGVQKKPFEIAFRGFGFFPNPKTARVFWVGIESSPTLGSLASAVDNATFTCGIAKEAHAFSPHLTLARGGRGSGARSRQKGDTSNKIFQHLQEKLAARTVPEFGTMEAHEFFLYQSQLSPGGSRYTKLERFLLR
jgi:RNA 2',3'-cyclic 3'-phosphodiesterase